MAQQNQKTINELSLEIQELRQALLAVLNKFNGAEGIPDNIRDHWWGKLTNYEHIQKENVANIYISCADRLDLAKWLLSPRETLNLGHITFEANEDGGIYIRVGKI